MLKILTSSPLVGVLVAFLVLVIIVGIGILFAGKGGGVVAGAYKRRRLMSPNEEEFFGRLVDALPECFVFPQVSMIALIEAASPDKRIAHRDRLRVAQQRVDYVICNKKLAVVMVVELDDRTHSAAKDQLRDQRLKQAGIRTVRFQSKNKPDVVALRAAIIAEVGGGQPKEKTAATEPAPAAPV